MSINVNQRLSTLKSQCLLRERRTISARSKHHVIIKDERLINFSGNDYLGLSQDDRVRDAMIAGVNTFGFGSGASPLLSGYSSAHHELEEYCAAFLQRDRALLFNSGYHANLGVITTFADRSSTIIADKEIHASMIDAIVLSRADHYRYRHHDLSHAEELLKQHRDKQPLLISESVFSMSGNITDATQLVTLANKYQALLLMDDAHGFGVLGERGRGISEHHSLNSSDLPILITPFGKALGGIGAIVSGSHDLIELLLQKARTYCYSTALPAAICCAALEAIRIIEQEPWRIARLQTLINYFHLAANERGIQLINHDLTPIKCILSGNNQQTLALQEILRARGFLVAAIRPPTVPVNQARLRISISIDHRETEITEALDVIAEHLRT